MATKQQKQTGRVDPAKPGEFNLAAFVDNALKTYQIVTVTNQPKPAQELSLLLLKLDALGQARQKLRERAAEATEDKDRRLAQKAASSEEIDAQEAELERQVAELFERTADSWLQVRVDPLEPRPRQELRKELDAREAAEELLPIDHTIAHLVAAGRLRPGYDGDGQDDDAGWAKLTDPDQWEELLKAIGAEQSNKVDMMVADEFYGDRGVTPDFFMRLSAYQATGASSKS